MKNKIALMTAFTGILGKPLYDKSKIYAKVLKKAVDLNNEYKNLKLNDKYKHALINCLMIQSQQSQEEIKAIYQNSVKVIDLYA